MYTYLATYLHPSLQITLEEALSLCQKYHFRMQSACEWLEDAVAFLQQASLGVDVENYEECLRQQDDIMATQQEFLAHLREIGRASCRERVSSPV